MPYYYYFFLINIILVIFLSVRFYILHKGSLSEELFVAGLKNENAGNLPAALLAYEAALTEARKARFNTNFKNKINVKLKLLRRVMEYEKNFHFPDIRHCI